MLAIRASYLVPLRGLVLRGVVALAVLAAWAASAFPKEDSVGEQAVNEFVDGLFSRALASPNLKVADADLDTSTLGKLSHGATSTRAALIPLPALDVHPDPTRGSRASAGRLPWRCRSIVVPKAAASNAASAAVQERTSTPLATSDASAIKAQILQIAALTDRGQRLNKLIAPTYQEKREEIACLVERLIALATASGRTPNEAQLAGDWELVFSDVELFRSSPFFLAIEEALNNSPGIPKLGRWLGATDPTKKAELFFKLHQLQVMSWGVSTVGRIGQTIDFEKGSLESTFDTTLFGLTVIPILGWFKLLPTFGGRVVTEATGLKLADNGTLCMELQRTQVTTAPGIPRIPLVNGLLMDRWYPVNAVWKLLPWNEGRAPTCSVKIEYVDEQMRISRDSAGAVFVYMRPLSSGGNISASG